nr:hypothetical protein DBT53_10370 [Aerococcus mictus]
MTDGDRTEHSEGDDVQHHLNQAHQDLHLALLHLAVVEDAVGMSELTFVRTLIARAIEQISDLHAQTAS